MGNLPLEILEIDSDYEDGRSNAEITGSSTSAKPGTPHKEDALERTYRKDGKYFLPNDLLEQERLNLQHALFYQTFHGKLYLAPIGESPGRVLDMGTGTGIWAINFATLHPTADVIGTDLSSMQPKIFPPNCHFEISNLEEIWKFDHKFDYIHGRALGTCFTDPFSVVTSAFEALTSGGYLEMQDAIMPMQYLGDIPTQSSLYKWNEYVAAAGELAKRPWTNVKNYPEYLQRAGFEDVTVKKFYWPTNAWPKGEYFKKLSVYFQENLMGGLEGLSMKLFTQFLGWEKERVQEFLVGVRDDLKDGSIHAFAQISVVYGRKPT